MELTRDDIYKDNKHLDDCKRNVMRAYKTFSHNFENYHKARNFIFKDTVSDDSKNKLNDFSIPAISFNGLETYISRLRGEWAKQEPNIWVKQQPDGAPVPPPVKTIVEGHIRSVLQEAAKDDAQFNVMSEQVGGGFSVFKVWTEYSSPMSFHQDIKFGKVFDPTLCGFDPLARKPHKGDGDYCFEIFPMLIEEIKKQYPEVTEDNLTYSQKIEGFNWSYKDGTAKVALICDYFEKVREKQKIVMLTNGQAMSKKKYLKLKDTFEKGTVALPPQVVKERETEITFIRRTRFIENQILEEEDMDYRFLPLVFVDGNSVWLRQANGQGEAYQLVRPYFKNAEGAQRMKDLIGQTIAYEVENMDGLRFVTAVEATPSEFMPAWSSPKSQKTLFYQFYNEDGTQNPPPIELGRSPFPDSLAQMWVQMDAMIQNILGGTTSNAPNDLSNMSGKAIVEAGMQQNANAMPYVVNYMTALNQVGQIILDLIPKYYVYPRLIPMVAKDGKNEHIGINGWDANSPSMDFEPTDLGIIVEAGVNFEVEKQRSLEMMVNLSQAFPSVAQLINTKGLPILFDNLDMRGADVLKELAQQMIEQQEQQAKQGQQAPNPAQMQMAIEQGKLQIDQQKLVNEKMYKQMEMQLKAAEIQNQALKNDNERMKIHMNNQSQMRKDAVAMHKAGVEEEDNVRNAQLENKRLNQEHHHAMFDGAVKLTQHLTNLMDKGEKRDGV